MIKLKVILLVLSCAAVLALSSTNSSAQPGAGGAGAGAGAGGGGGRRGRGANGPGGAGGAAFDPAARRAQQMLVYKEGLGVTDDGEWAVLEAAIGKVLDARTALQAFQTNMRGGGRRGGGAAGPGGAPGAPGAPVAGGGRGGFGTPPADELTALQTAIDNKAPADEIKAKLAALRTAYAAADAKLVSAQEDLKKLLTSRQEAIGVIEGLLK